MEQTKAVSLIETIFNTLLGFFISWAAWPLAAVVCGVNYSSEQQLSIVLFFTVISVVRGYFVRRFFNAGLHRAALALWSAVRF